MKDPKTGLEIPDMGGVPIPGSSFDVGSGGSTTFKTAGQIPPPPPMALPPAPLATPAPAAIPQAIPAAPRTPPAIPAQMPSMLDVLRQAQAAGGSLYGQYSPENRNQLYAAMLERRGGMGNAIGAGLASAGDAIARGYGRSNSDFLDKTLQGQDQAVKEGLGAFDEGQKATLTATSAGMELQKMDPNSAASKIAKAAYGPLLEKLGYSKEDMGRMSGANVEAVAKVAADYGGKEIENLYRNAMLAVQQMQAQAEIANKVAGRKAEALQESVKHPVLNALPKAMQPANIRAINQEAGIEAPSGSAQTLFAKNAEGHRIMSTDGGKSWAEAK